MKDIYRIELSFTEDGKLHRKHDFYYSTSPEKAVEQCLDAHSGLLWDHQDVEIHKLWQLHYILRKHFLLGFFTRIRNRGGEKHG